MARPLRVDFPHAVHHVMARGNGGQPIYLDDRDRESFLGQLSESVSRFSLWIHAYCLMGNHYHLLVETPLANLSRGMRQLNGVYAQRFNRRHGAVGHLFQARFHAVLVEKERHLLAVARYILRNPVRAGLTRSPEQWPWSSLNATTGRAPCPDFLKTDWLLGQFGADRVRAQERFRRFVCDGPEEEAGAPHGGLYLGSKAFALAHAPAAPVPEVPRRHWLPVRAPLEALLADGTGDAIAGAVRQGYTLAEIARRLGVHYSTVSRRLRAYESATPSNGSRPMR